MSNTGFGTVSAFRNSFGLYPNATVARGSSGGGGGGEAVKTSGDVPLLYPDDIDGGTLGCLRIELGGAIWCKLSFDVILPGATTDAGVPLAWGANPYLTDLNAPFNTMVMLQGLDSGYAMYSFSFGIDIDGSGSGVITQVAGGDPSTTQTQTVYVLCN